MPADYSESKLVDSLNRYNIVLDLLTQIRVTIDMMWHPMVMNHQLEIVKALVFQEMKIIENDLQEVRQNKPLPFATGNNVSLGSNTLYSKR